MGETNYIIKSKNYEFACNIKNILENTLYSMVGQIYV
jgi:hypothetical protein